MSLLGLRAVVIGAGIGGLAVARALALRGADVTLLEQAPEITEVGAGLQISPNGMAVLRALGLDRALQDASVRARAVCLKDHRDRDVVRLDLGRLADSSYHFVHRADLIDLLAQGAREAGVKIRLLHHVTAVDGGAQPVVHLATGSRIATDLVIGADGLHSVLRPILNGPQAPFFTGQVAWRAIVPNTEARGPEAWVHMGPGRHIVSYPLRDGRALNIVAVQERKAWADEGWHHADDPDNLRAAFADFGAGPRAMLDQVTEARLWGLFRHPVARIWQADNLALLGDAAHPTLPFLAQGASMALEDAWVLADELARCDSLGAGLVAYQARREGRVRRVISAANGNAWKYHIGFPPLRMAAHAVMRLGGAVAPDRMMKQFSWLYDHDVTAE
ncbi:MAG: FAD-dependent oxidoreductase [Rhodobacterales bacterium]|nr:FAD-dependent oxidoreductase [Rhodobacterales bacterium]MDX5391985.1 FAD-dependent oxidoreductase [Rhodobacterales bacterium]MDX5491676.1 FAD-dependent oxidoreductase [Rhodobacterales bacterium]